MWCNWILNDFLWLLNGQYKTAFQALSYPWLFTRLCPNFSFQKCNLNYSNEVENGLKLCSYFVKDINSILIGVVLLSTNIKISKEQNLKKSSKEVQRECSLSRDTFLQRFKVISLDLNNNNKNNEQQKLIKRNKATEI